MRIEFVHSLLDEIRYLCAEERLATSTHSKKNSIFKKNFYGGKRHFRKLNCSSGEFD
ncbi:MAG: hypothetical protein ACFFAN_09915 [Promethearchaeota archaeon]